MNSGPARQVLATVGRRWSAARLPGPPGQPHRPREFDRRRRMWYT